MTTEFTPAELAEVNDKCGRILEMLNSIPKDDFLDLWENRNDQLRNLGIKLVPLE